MTKTCRPWAPCCPRGCNRRCEAGQQQLELAGDSEDSDEVGEREGDLGLADGLLLGPVPVYQNGLTQRGSRSPSRSHSLILKYHIGETLVFSECIKLIILFQKVEIPMCEKYFSTTAFVFNLWKDISALLKMISILVPLPSCVRVDWWQDLCIHDRAAA